MKENIKVRSIIEIIGSPEDYVNQILDRVVVKLEERKEIKLINKSLFKAEKMKDKPLWSSFVDAEMDVEGIDSLLSFCIDFMPSSIEILEPNNFNLNSNKITNMFNDLLAKLHENNIILRNAQAENIILKRELEKNKENK